MQNQRGAVSCNWNCHSTVVMNWAPVLTKVWVARTHQHSCQRTTGCLAIGFGQNNRHVTRWIFDSLKFVTTRNDAVYQLLTFRCIRSFSESYSLFIVSPFWRVGVPIVNQFCIENIGNIGGKSSRLTADFPCRLRAGFVGFITNSRSFIDFGWFSG